MMVYLDKKIVAEKTVMPRIGAGMTRAGYTCMAGAPTSKMIQLEGEKVWRRLMVWQFSNAGTCFVRIKGVAYIVRDFGVI